MKKILLLVMAMMLSFSAMCFASDGADLDAEAKIMDQFLSGKDYKKSGWLHGPGMGQKLFGRTV